MQPILALVAAASLFISQTAAAANTTSKRGIAYIVGGHGPDYNMMLASKSPMSWYYTWKPTTAPADIWYGDQSQTIEFVPTIHNNTKLDADLESLKRVPASSKYLFTFNEPDGTFDTGGCDLSPQDAARDYIAKVVPLRSRFQISHPSTTGSPRGFKWLQDFNAACWKIDPKNGCPTDFVVVHWYGDFIGMTSWLGQLAAWYREGKVGLQGDLRMWVTELGAPGAPMDVNMNVMTQTLPFLDQLDYVDRYAWFGAFRPSGANNWTGDGLSLFTNDGGLSTLGALYLGGQASGFAVGDKGQENNNTGSSGNGTGTGTGSGNGTGNGTTDGQGGNKSRATDITSTATSTLWICIVAMCLWVL